MTTFPHADLTHRIIGLAMRVHTRLGPGLLENAYEHCLCHEFYQHGIPYRRQVELPLIYDSVTLDCGYRADVIVNNEVILELKSIEGILPLHEARCSPTSGSANARSACCSTSTRSR